MRKFPIICVAALLALGVFVVGYTDDVVTTDDMGSLMLNLARGTPSGLSPDSMSAHQSFDTAVVNSTTQTSAVSAVAAVQQTNLITNATQTSDAKVHQGIIARAPVAARTNALSVNGALIGGDLATPRSVA